MKKSPQEELKSHSKKIKVKNLLLSAEPKHDIIVEGWVRTKRDSKAFSFIELNDGSTIKNIQIFVDAKLENYEKDIKKLTIGASLKVEGDLVESPGKGQKFEIHAKKVHVYGFADPYEYPLQKKELTMEYLRTVAHLRARTNLFAAVFRIRSELAFAIHKFFHDKNFVYVHTPILTSSDCEATGNMFKVTTLDLNHIPKTKDGKIDYSDELFGKTTYLTGSGQLHGELFATALGNIYTFGPTFRTENSNTFRHASEFWMIEPEMAFYELDDLMALEEEFLKYIIKHILDACKDDMEFLASKTEQDLIDKLQKVVSSEFKHLSYTEAIELLKKANKKFEAKPEWGLDLGSEHERYLTEEYFKCPVIVYNYPKAIKSFYMKQNEDGKTARGTDVLVPGIGEIIGGSQREENYDRLISAIKEKGFNEADYAWFLDTRKFGTVPHSGFGLGFERMLMFVTGIPNIRDVIPFPRTPKNVEY